MANHKSAHSGTSKARQRQIEHKSARAAARQALTGGHYRHVRSSSWNAKLPDAPLLDDASPTRRSRRARSRWCRGKVGVEHKPVYGRCRNRRWCCWYCEVCHKSLWGYRPKLVGKPDSAAEHWSMSNITRRLAGLPCLCPTCGQANP